ncbi:putative RNA-directed DNA polymerase from transposon X-element [Trichonephila clavipes]|nr:putative RNA-directed DNA polymerase from transposon X-element [Trichonephila clavipes]
MKRLYDARPSNIRPFMDRMKLHISELDLPNVRIQQRNLFLFQPWNTPRFHYINPFATYSKSTVAPVVFQRVFAYHRSQYSRYSAIYTDGSKRADYVGCGVVIEDIMHGYRLDTSCSIFTAEAVAIYRALQLIDSTMPRKYCIYTDSMSVLEALENYHDRCHPVVCTILDITSRLYSKGFDIVFCWLPSHVGIIGNEQADSAAKSATTHLPLAVPLSDMKRVIMHHIFKIWQESWSQQLDNKLHSVKPVIGAWPVMPMRRTDVKLTRLRIGHTRFTHRHLLFGERAPECPSCHVSYTVHHILIDCPVFNHHRITFFHTSILTLSDLRRKSDGRFCRPDLRLLAPCEEQCEDLMTSFISWNCRGLRTRLADLKSIISTYQPACVALQETFLKSTMTMQVRGYNCVRRDVDGDTSPTGGLCKPWWNASCQQAKKEQRRAWGIFRRYPTTDNLIAFKRAKALARRIRRQCQRESWIQYVSSITSSTTSQQLWRKVKAANGLYRDFYIPILETSTALYSSPLDVANLIGKTFASVSSSDSYSPAFQATKNRLERTPINFRCRQPLPYNCDFDMFELKRALSSAHNTSPGPDGISYELLRHLNEDSLVSLLYLFNRIWREQVYPTQWQEAIVIPILRPGKDPKNPLSYRPIALTSCLCKTLERMVNAPFRLRVRKEQMHSSVSEWLP